MDQRAVFLQLARQEGFYPDAALSAFNTIEASLNQVGYGGQTTFYVYRIIRREGGEAEGEAGKDPGAPGAEPSRLLLVFSSPDAALAFAQQHRLRPTPRLLSLNLAQLLATLVQRPALRALIFSEENAATSPATHHIPTVFRLERQELLAMLKGTAP